MKEKTKNISMMNIAKAFWRGMAPDRLLFSVTLIVFPLSTVIDLIIPLFYKKFFDAIVDSGENKATLAPDLIHIILMVLLLNLLGWVLFRGGVFILNVFEARVMARLKQISFDYLIDHSYSFFSNTFTGSLVQRVGRFSRSFERIYETVLFNFIALFINIVGVVFVVSLEHPLIAGIILVWSIVVMAVSYFFSRWKMKYDLASAAADSTTTARLADVVGNQNTVASFTGSRHESKAFTAVSNDQARATLLTWNLAAVLDTIQASLVIAIEFIVFYVAIQYWKVDMITAGTFVLIQTYIISIAHRLWGLGRAVRNVYEGVADSKEMVDILMTPHEVQDVPMARPLSIAKGEIDFDDVSFGFNKDRSVLNQVKLGVRGGEKVALIGPSGAGKSTFVKLLLRMYNLAEGTITIDGQDIQKVTQESLRNAISLVPQDPILFHRSLMENIRYGRRHATDEEVISAAKLAHCDEFIDVLPQKYETYVGERGIKLSGGERQRVAIARAILKNAPILVLDEATSSLDSHSESLIQDALDKLMHGRTTIVIAHRLSTIRKMDRILVLEDGKVIEDGTHDALLAKEESLYKRLWTLQAGGFLAD